MTLLTSQSQPPARLSSSVVSFPDRGPDGQNTYRGNTSGYVVEAFLHMFHRDPAGLFVDPAEGSGTARDVARRLGIRYAGFDLRSGFDVTMSDILLALNHERPHSAFMHLPYWKQIVYSDNPLDLSNAPDLDTYLELAQLAAMNVYDALQPNGHYAFLMGNYRKDGVYYPLAAMLELVLPGKLREEVIKIQHNTQSDRRAYAGAGTSFVPIAHEKLLIYQKTSVLFALDFTIESSLFLNALKDATWKNIIRRALIRNNNQPMSLAQIYDHVEGTQRAKANPHWQAKVRQVLRVYPNVFRCLERGVYSLA